MSQRRRVTGSPLHAVSYLRVSTDDQSLGVEAQRAAIAAWASTAGVELVGEYEDLGVSGGADLDERPGLMAAIGAVEATGAGLLVVAKRDRLARDVVLAAAIESLAAGRGAKVVAADGMGNGDGPEGMLMRGLVDLFAAYERALIRARTKAALAVKKSRGELTGTAPLGKRVGTDGVMLEGNEDERAAIALILELSANGATVRGIARDLNAAGIAARGSRWHPTTVQRVLSAHAHA